MEELQNHLEEVIADMANGSETVKPLTHLEKVIQATGQAIAEGGGGGAELFRHRCYFTTQYQEVNFSFIMTFISSKEESYTISEIFDLLYYINSTPMTIHTTQTGLNFVVSNVYAIFRNEIQVITISNGSYVSKTMYASFFRSFTDTVYDMEGQLV